MTDKDDELKIILDRLIAEGWIYEDTNGKLLPTKKHLDAEGMR